MEAEKDKKKREQMGIHAAAGAVGGSLGIPRRDGDTRGGSAAGSAPYYGYMPYLPQMPPQVQPGQPAQQPQMQQPVYPYPYTMPVYPYGMPVYPQQPAVNPEQPKT